MEEGKRISKRKKTKNGKEKVKDERREGKKKKIKRKKGEEGGMVRMLGQRQYLN